MPAVCLEHPTRFSLKGAVSLDHSTRFNLLSELDLPVVDMEHSTRFELSAAQVDFSHSTRFMVQPDLFYRVFVVGEEEAKEYRNDYAFEVWLAGPEGDLELTPYVKSGSLRQSIEGPAEFSLNLDPASRELRPKLRSGDLFYQRFDGDAFDEDFNLRRWLKIGIWSGGKVWWSPKLLQLDYDWTMDNQGQRQITLGGTDLSELLLQNDQNLDSYFSTQARIYTAHGIMGAMLGRYKIKYRFDFDDFQISQFTAKGATAWDYLRTCMWPMQAESFFDGDQFVAQNPIWKPNNSRGVWSLRAGHDLKSYSYKKSIRDLKNEFTIKRPGKVPTPLAEVELRQTGNSTLIPLNPPSRNIIPEIVTPAFHGDLTLWTYFDAQGNPIPGAVFSRAAQVVLGVPAAFVRVTYVPTYDLTNPWPPGVPPYAKIVFWGSGRYNVGDEAFIVVGRDAASQARFGKRRDRSPTDTTLIVDRATAQKTTRRLASISARRSQPSQWTAMLNGEAMPGELIDLVCSEAGFFDPTIFKVEAVNKNFDQQGNFLMGVECSGNQA